MTHYQSITIRIEDDKLIELKNIVKTLFESNAISSDKIEDFMKFTLFIIFDEFEKNVDSLKKFYSMNLDRFLENN